MNFQGILVPVDFSDCSWNALRGAVNFSRLIHAELLLVHAYHVPVPHMEAGAAAIVQPLMEGYEANVELEFQSLLKLVPELEELSYEYRCVHGFATDTILDIVSSELIDLIIMETKGSYLRSARLPSPMGMYITGFGDVEEARRIAEEVQGKISTWDELVHKFGQLPVLTKMQNLGNAE